MSLAALVLAGGRATRVGGGDKPLLPVAGRPMLDQILEDLLAQRCARVVVVGPDRLPVPPGVELTLENPPFGGPVAGIIAGLRYLAGSLGAISNSPAPPLSELAGESGNQSPRNPGIATTGTPDTRNRPSRNHSIATTSTPDLVAVLAGDSPAGAALLPSLVAGLHTDLPRAANVISSTKEAMPSRTTAGLKGMYDGCVVRNSSGFRQYLCGVYHFEALAIRAHEVGTSAGRNMSVRRFFQPLNLAEIPDTQNLSRDFDTWEDINSAQ